jgi:hypothetical protein
LTGPAAQCGAGGADLVGAAVAHGPSIIPVMDGRPRCARG